MGNRPQHVVDGSKGQVNLAVRLYPLPFHGPNAVLAATTALCVADQAGAAGYYRFLAAWLARTGSNGRGIDDGDARSAHHGDPVAAMAARAGAANVERLAGCTTSDRTGERLAAEMKAADRAGIEGTPAIALRDNRQGRAIMVSGAISEADMRDAVDRLRQADDAPTAPSDAAPSDAAR